MKAVKYILPGLLSLWMLLASQAEAQRIAPIGDWTSYASHNAARDILRKGDRYYVITDGGFYWYDFVTGEKRTYSPVEGLSGVSPTALHYDETTDFLFLGYADGVVNMFREPEDGILFITDIERTDQFTTKSINNFASRDGMLYIGTEFGVVIYDIAKRETRNSVTKVADNNSGTAVKDLVIVGDTIYLSMGNAGVFFADLNVTNITVPDAWTESTGNRGLPSGESHLICAIDETIYVQVNDSIFNKAAGANWKKGPFSGKKYINVDGSNGVLYATYDKVIRVKRPEEPQFIWNTKHRIMTAEFDSTFAYLGDTVRGLLLRADTGLVDTLTPEGPFNNLVTQLAVGNGELVIAPDGRTGPAEPAGSFDGFYHFSPATGWNRFNVDDELNRDSVYAEFARAHYDVDSRTAYVGSWNHGVIRLEDGEITGVWTSKNSNMSPSYNQQLDWHTRVSGLAVDRDDNLWITAALADFNLMVKTTDDVWHRLNIPSATPVEVIIDDWGNKWVNNHGQGVVVYNETGTIDDISDDQIKYLSSDGGNGALPNNLVLSLVKDLRGHIWVGTLEGVAVFANPGSVFSGNFADASCPVIDGFCLLRDQRISAIAVDGANRKWIGTNNGVYVVNAQGNQQLFHYTTENSPIFSDAIRDIQIDQQTGEVFIGTDKGVVSLMGDATGGKETSEDLYVFPNPISVDYDGTVAISCSVADAEVRITTVSGRLVRALETLGGQAVWDFRDAAGQRLVPGIYLAMVADRDGKNAGIAKFAVLERAQ